MWRQVLFAIVSTEFQITAQKIGCSIKRAPVLSTIIHLTLIFGIWPLDESYLRYELQYTRIIMHKFRVIFLFNFFVGGGGGGGGGAGGEGYMSRCFYTESKIRGANMGPIWARQDPCGPHVDAMNSAVWVVFVNSLERTTSVKNHIMPIKIKVVYIPQLHAAQRDQLLHGSYLVRRR